MAISMNNTRGDAVAVGADKLEAVLPFDPQAPLLEVEDLHVEFRTRDGVVRAVNGVTFSLNAGDTLAIVGESGCGKSVTAQAVMGILDTPPAHITHGQVRLHGVDVLKLSEKWRRKVRANRIAMVFQDALSALNPVFTVGFQLGELYRKHRGASRREAKDKAVELLDTVRIPAAADRINDYPHQFSGGMRQRVMVAMALALEPEVLIADEPTTALDVTVQAQIMKLLSDLQTERDMGLILITHDMGVVADVADRLCVMYAGEVAERADVHDIYREPAHPYTKALLESIPRVDQKGQQLTVIQGLPPQLSKPIPGCPFQPRCGYAKDNCKTDDPPLREVTGHGSAQRDAACHYFEEVLQA